VPTAKTIRLADTASSTIVMEDTETLSCAASSSIAFVLLKVVGSKVTLYVTTIMTVTGPEVVVPFVLTIPVVAIPSSEEEAPPDVNPPVVVFPFVEFPDDPTPPVVDDPPAVVVFLPAPVVKLPPVVEPVVVFWALFAKLYLAFNPSACVKETRQETVMLIIHIRSSVEVTLLFISDWISNVYVFTKT